MANSKNAPQRIAYRNLSDDDARNFMAAAYKFVHRDGEFPEGLESRSFKTDILQSMPEDRRSNLNSIRSALAVQLSPIGSDDSGKDSFPTNRWDSIKRLGTLLGFNGGGQSRVAAIDTDLAEALDADE